MKVWFSFLCQLFHVNQLSRLFSIVLPWRFPPILGWPSLLISTNMTAIADFFLNISFHAEERNRRHLSLKKIGLNADAFLGLRKSVQKTYLIASGVLNLFLPDWAKDIYKKTPGCFPLCVRNYLVNPFTLIPFTKQLNGTLPYAWTVHRRWCSHHPGATETPACLTDLAGTPEWSLELWRRCTCRFICCATFPPPLPCHSLCIVQTPRWAQG